MAETDTSPAALRALADYWASEKPAGVDPDEPDTLDAVLEETEDKMAETIAALRALAAEKEAGAPAPDAEGWIPWEGGDCPVAEGTRVRVRYCTGAEDEDYAGAWFWSKFDADPIIAYRLSKEG